MKISKARTSAFDVLRRVEERDAYADEALRAELGPSVKPEDAGLATELVLGVLRWQRLLDFVLDRHLKKPGSVADAEVRIALRLGAYQILFLTRIPARAAVHESVELVKRAKKSSAATLVNAVLRKIADKPVTGNSPAEAVAAVLPQDLPLPEGLAIQFSHPTWMVERWLETFGEERTRSLLLFNNRAPSLSAAVLAPEHRDKAVAALQKSGSNVTPGKLLRDSLVIDGGNPSACEAAQKGWIAFQDEASQAVAALVAARPGDRVLDLCAAPGGKTLLLSRAVGERGHIIAADLHEHRVRAMKERFERAGTSNIETVALDGSQSLPFEQRFERILVDVPCSGTGTLARHPEIRWRLRPEDLRDLHERQVRLLRNALQHLSAGGRLVYSTCSLEPEENEQVVSEVLGKSGRAFALVDARPAIQPLLEPSVRVDSIAGDDGFFRTFSPEHGTDGFFAAVIETRE